jgi:hypothetical protein
MGNFVKLTTRSEDGSYTRTWIDQSFIRQVFQNSVTQGGNNEGTCVFQDGTTMQLVSFNETLDSLS